MWSRNQILQKGLGITAHTINFILLELNNFPHFSHLKVWRIRTPCYKLNWKTITISNLIDEIRRGGIRVTRGIFHDFLNLTWSLTSLILFIKPLLPPKKHIKSLNSWHRHNMESLNFTISNKMWLESYRFNSPR